MEDLVSNDAFLDAVQYATQAALRTSQLQKRTALKNAVVNSALPGAPELAVQQMFLALLDTFTEWHLSILRMIADGIARVSDTVYASTENLRPLAQAIEIRFPELKDQKEFARQVCADLVTRGLIKRPGIGTQDLMAVPMVQLGVTALGSQLLDFIREA